MINKQELINKLDSKAGDYYFTYNLFLFLLTLLISFLIGISLIVTTIQVGGVETFEKVVNSQGYDMFGGVLAIFAIIFYALIHFRFKREYLKTQDEVLERLR